MLLFLVCAAANDDYAALKKLYEATGGSTWTHNANWDMSNTDVCGWNDPDAPTGRDQQVSCTGGRLAFAKNLLCSLASARVDYWTVVAMDNATCARLQHFTAHDKQHACTPPRPPP